MTTGLEREEDVHFLGPRSQQEVIEALQEADVFVLPSRSEGLPIVCTEAMATGALLLATRITGLPEVVEDGSNGMLVEPDDPAAPSQALTWIDRHRDDRRQIRQNARTTVEQRCNRKRQTEELLEAMKSASRRAHGA